MRRRVWGVGQRTGGGGGTEGQGAVGRGQGGGMDGEAAEGAAARWGPSARRVGCWRAAAVSVWTRLPAVAATPPARVWRTTWRDGCGRLTPGIQWTSRSNVRLETCNCTAFFAQNDGECSGRHGPCTDTVARPRRNIGPTTAGHHGPTNGGVSPRGRHAATGTLSRPRGAARAPPPPPAAPRQSAPGWSSRTAPGRPSRRRPAAPRAARRPGARP